MNVSSVPASSWFLLVIMMLAGCAATYQAPEGRANLVTRSVRAPVNVVVRAAQRVLIEEGYQVTSASEEAGTVSTAPRDLRVGPERADCGTTMGLDYLKDNRTRTRVAYGITVGGGQLTVRAIVQGEYKIGRFDQDITLSCLSRGALEEEMAAKILAAVGG